MAGEPVQLLVHIHALHKQRDFLLQAIGIHRDGELREALGEAGADGRAHLGQPRAHIGHQLLELVAALLDEPLEPRALAGAHGPDVGERLAEQHARGLGQRLGIAARLAQHAGESQQVGEVHLQLHALGLLAGGGQFTQQRREPIDQRAIEREAAIGLCGDAISKDRVHLAAPQLFLQLRAQLAFQRAQLFRQPDCGLQEAVIDAAQLADERATGDWGFAAGEARHADDHRLAYQARGAGAIIRQV